MKKVLVIHYSQTGQLTQILESVVRPLKETEEVELIFEEIKPKKAFPFPWGAMNFFDAMPESVKEIPCELEPFQFKESDDFDLIILAYQVWYLSPSIPISSFLQSQAGRKVLKKRPVITIIGCRNMWLNAQEKVKRHIYRAGAQLVGNIVLTDKDSNLVSVITVIGWLIYGKKSGFLKVFPTSGVSNYDIKESSRFGYEIVEALNIDEWSTLQERLNRDGAVEVFPNLMVLENRGARAFKIWANFIGSEGKPGDPKRRFRVFLLLLLLPMGIFILSPLTALLTFLKLKLSKKQIRKQVHYYLRNDLAG